MSSDGRQNSLPEDVVPYKLHVSSRYLELTKRKLELTRMPREVELPKEREWTFGTPKSALEPLVDLWVDGFSWRDQESVINEELTQFRTEVAYTIPFTTNSSHGESNEENLRVHFVHRRSVASDAIPLLYCHGWPGCFLEVSKIIGPLSSPIPTHLHAPDDSPAFHVVAPSIPGFGFSDPSTLGDFGVRHTALVFHELMKKLGYERYMIYGFGWGFQIAQQITISHPNEVLGLLTSVNIDTPTLTPSMSLATQASLSLSNHLRGRLIWTSALALPPTSTEGLATLASQPQTAAYALCDSPAGLLAAMVHHIYETGHLPLWRPTDVLTWTMLLWLPGPESPLRWLRAARTEANAVTKNRWNDVPVGVHVYHAPEGPHEASTGMARWTQRLTRLWSEWRAKSEPVGLAGMHNVVWVKRSTGSVGVPGWDAASDVILDLREFCATGRREGWLKAEVQGGAVQSEENSDSDEVRHQNEPDLEQGTQCKSRSWWGWLSGRGAKKVEEEPDSQAKEGEGQPDDGTKTPEVEPGLPPATPITVIEAASPTDERPELVSVQEKQNRSMLSWLWPFKKDSISQETTVTANSLAATEQPSELVDRTGQKDESGDGLGITGIESTQDQLAARKETERDVDIEKVAETKPRDDKNNKQQQLTGSKFRWPFQSRVLGEKHGITTRSLDGKNFVLRVPWRLPFAKS